MNKYIKSEISHLGWMLLKYIVKLIVFIVVAIGGSFLAVIIESKFLPSNIGDNPIWIVFVGVQTISFCVIGVLMNIEMVDYLFRKKTGW